jgi:hypothetical protein
MKRGFELLILIGLLPTLSCVTAGKSLRAVTISYPNDIQGSYTMIVHGGEGQNFLLLLDREDDDYRFIPPKGNNRYVRGVRGEEINEVTWNFAGAFSNARLIRIREILDENDRVIGYEMTPQVFISSEPPEVKYYLQKDGDVKVKLE